MEIIFIKKQSRTIDSSYAELATLVIMGSFERAIPDPAMLARLLRELDTPMDQHVAMIDAVDWANEQWFERELVRDPRVREEHERFLFASHDDESDDDF
jgi:hypothetical protein